MIRPGIRILLLVLAVHAAGAQSADLPRIATPTLTQRPPVIDGRLDDEVWRTATPLTGFVQRELREGEPVTERTEVRIASDGLALYIGAWLLDKDPAGIVSGEKIRDVSLDNSDYVAIILDTYLDRQNGFVISGNGEIIEPDDGILAIGSGGSYALAAARALVSATSLSPAEIAVEAGDVVSIETPGGGAFGQGQNERC